MTEILTAALKNNTDPDRVWVVDLFAGYGSRRAAATQKELNYLAVDWRDFISGDKLHKATATSKEDRLRPIAESWQLVYWNGVEFRRT